jgi:rfaE bifunctional protein kinase chain/domain
MGLASVPLAVLRPSDLSRLLAEFSRLRIGLLGDLFLDKYLDLDHQLTELSIETGLEAYQVVRTRCYPGAGGTVLNNLRALGVGELTTISVIGDDGEGYELLRELRDRQIETAGVLVRADRMTPTYTKPMLSQAGKTDRELNRLDIKNRTSPSAEIDAAVIAELRRQARGLDALIIADQVTERNRGVVTDAVREELARLAQENPQLLIFADSRSHLKLFRNVTVKPNRSELLGPNHPALEGALGPVTAAAEALGRATSRPVYITLGPNGILVVDGANPRHVPGVCVSGPIDIVGAGDSTTAGIVATLAAGGTPEQAATVGCLVASITIQQLGMTGTATPAQVEARLVEGVRSPVLDPIAR